MRLAVINAHGALHQIVELDEGAPPYAPPAGASVREATPEDETAASSQPGYAPPSEDE